MRSDRLNRVRVRRPVRDVEHSRRSRRRSSVRRSLALGGSTRSLTYVNSRHNYEANKNKTKSRGNEMLFLNLSLCVRKREEKRKQHRYRH